MEPKQYRADIIGTISTTSMVALLTAMRHRGTTIARIKLAPGSKHLYTYLAWVESVQNQRGWSVWDGNEKPIPTLPPPVDPSEWEPYFVQEYAHWLTYARADDDIEVVFEVR